MSIKVAAIRTRTAVVALVLVAVAATFLASLLKEDTKHGVAYFDSVTSVYPNDKIRILGIEVGKIEKVTPEDDRVRVEFSYDAKYDLPEDVMAAVVSPTLVATRFIQLEPAYERGPKFPDGGVIPVERTASPLEFDDLKTELSRLSSTLGPNGADQTGALADFLDVAASNGKGRGAKFNAMVTELSAALGSLAEGRGDIFGTVRNLQVFVSAMAAIDGQVAGFNRNLAGVSDLLDDSGPELAAAIASVDRAARLVRGFVKENRPVLTKATSELGDLTTMLASSRDQLATVLHAGPNTITNFANIFTPRYQGYTGGLMVDQLSTPGQLLCSLVAHATAAEGNGLEACSAYLGPLLDKLGIDAPPVGVRGPLEIPGGGEPYPAPAETPPPGMGVVPPAGGGGGLLGLLMPGGAS